MLEKENTILVIDDALPIRRLTTVVLEKNGYKVLSAWDGVSGLEVATSSLPQVILLDIVLPDMDGYQVCQILKSDPRTKDIPVIILTSNSKSVDKVRGLKVGASDYITKPFDFGEFLARISTQVKMKNLWDELQEKNKILEELIKKDSLTELYNHRYFMENIANEFERSERYSFDLSCVILDIDHFKKVNDTYGHQAGDYILKAIARIVQNETRKVDIAARYGGEEFGLILPHINIDQAYTLCERIRKKLK